MKTISDVVGSPGRPLDAVTRQRMEPSLGFDLSTVRVHTDQSAAGSATLLGADAYTVGSHIVFGAGTYHPGSRSGDHLLAHELAHVAQQSCGPVAGREIGDGLFVSDPADAYERRAAAFAGLAGTHFDGGERGDGRLRQLPRHPAESSAFSVQRLDTATKWGIIGGVAGIVGAGIGLVAAAFALGAWAHPKNPSGTAAGVSIHPDGFGFSTVDPSKPGSDTIADPDAYKKALSSDPEPKKILELRTGDDEDASLNLMMRSDNRNIISASVVPGETKGYLGGYNSSSAVVNFSQTVLHVPAAPSAATPSPATPGAATPATQSAGGGAAAPAPDVGEVIVHFGGTNTPGREPTQTFAGELSVKADGQVNCLSCNAHNAIGGYGKPMGSYGLVDYHPAAKPAPVVSPTGDSSGDSGGDKKGLDPRDLLPMGLGHPGTPWTGSGE
ncbi:MAG: DUF4157 domain-containing protein [Candidatus Cybelea sp.]